MKKKMKGYATDPWGSNESPFEFTQRPNNDWAYMGGMVPEDPREFGSAPSEKSLSRFPHHVYGTAGLGAALEDGASGMDRHVAYIVPTNSNDLFE
jgi:hypothetical protein